MGLRAVPPPGSNAITYTPDDLHGTFVRVARGQTWVEHDVDAFGRESRSFKRLGLTVWLGRDTCARVTFTSDPYISGPGTQGTAVQYDALGRVKQVTASAGKVTTFAPTGIGLTRADANNHSTVFDYMAF